MAGCWTTNNLGVTTVVADAQELVLLQPEMLLIQKPAGA